MTISIDQFLQAEDFDIAENITFTPFNPEDLEDFGNIAFSTTEFIQLEALDGLSESSAKADQSDQPFTPSFQPLNEAGVLTAGETLNKSAVGSTTNNSIGVQNSSMEFLGNTAQFNTETDFNLTEEAIEQIEEAQKTLATGTLGLANSLDLAEGGIKFSTTNMSFGATNILMGTEGTYHLAAPVISTVAGVESKQAQTIQQTADLITDNSKNKVSQVEGLSSSIAANTMTTSLEGQINVSNYATNTAVQKIVNTSNVVQNVGNELVQNRSQGSIANQASGAVVTQGADVSITASAGSISPLGNGTKSLNPLDGDVSFEDAGNGFANITATDPSGKETVFKNVDQSANFTQLPKWQNVGGLEGRDAESVAPTQAKKGGGNIVIVSNEGNTTVLNKNLILSSEGSSNQTVGGNLVQNAKGSATISGNFANIEAQVGTSIQSSGYIREQAGKTGTFYANGFTFAGFRFGGIKKFIDQAKNVPLKLRVIPNLPDLPPGISYQDLVDCLPDKYRNPPNGPDVTEESESPDASNAPTIEEAGRRNKQIAVPVGKELSGGVTEEDGVDAATQGSKGNRNDPNTLLSTNTSPTDQATALGPSKVVGAATVIKGGSDVFPKDKEVDEDPYNRVDQEIIDPDADEELGGPEFLNQAANAINSRFIIEVANVNLIGPNDYQIITPDAEAVRDYVKSILLEDSTLINTEDLATIQGYLNNTDKPNLKLLIEAVKDEIVQRASIGGVLSFLSSAYNRVKGNIGLVNDVVGAVNERNVFNVIRTTVAAAGAITDREIFSDIGNVIDSSAALSNLYGQVNSVITNPDAKVSDIIDTINFKDIETVIQKGLGTVGVDNLQTASSIARILNNIKNSEEYKEEGLSTDVVFNIINQISQETGLTTRDATQVYEDSKDVIALVLEGQVRDALLSSELTSILGFFVGESNAALLGDLQQLYFSSLGAIDEVGDIVNTGRAIYSTVNNIYTQLKAIPAFIGLMNAYEMPTLVQAQTVFKCFELMKQINSIINDVEDIAGSIDSIRGVGEDAFDVLDAFSELLGGQGTIEGSQENQSGTPFESISGGYASGGIVGTGAKPTTDLNIPINVAATDTSEQFRDIATINDDPANTTNTGATVTGVAGEEDFISSGDENINRDPELPQITPQVCLNSILDATVDTNHSDDPQNWKPKRNNLDAVDIIEKLPRLAQIFNSVVEAPADNPGIANFLTPEQINDLKTTKTIPPVNNCYIGPKLNLLEATIEVIEIKNNVLLYRMLAADTLKLNNKNIFPTTNTIVQLYIRRFFDAKTGSELRVQRNQDFFSPILYNFKTISYHRERNLGLAHLLAQPTRIHLKNTNNVTYNYSITDIGNRLNPDILDAYIIA